MEIYRQWKHQDLRCMAFSYSPVSHKLIDVFSATGPGTVYLMEDRRHYHRYQQMLLQQQQQMHQQQQQQMQAAAGLRPSHSVWTNPSPYLLTTKLFTHCL